MKDKAKATQFAANINNVMAIVNSWDIPALTKGDINREVFYYYRLVYKYGTLPSINRVMEDIAADLGQEWERITEEE